MDIEAYILIGGRSSRLGRDKAFASVGGKSLAEHALQIVKDGVEPVKTVFVAGNAAQFAIEAITLDVPFIFDLIPDRGPLGGLHAALSYAQTSWILLLACDMPLLTPEFLTLHATHVSDEFAAVVPEQPDGRLQPLCAFFEVAKAYKLVDEIIHRPRASPPMFEIVQELDPKIVKFEKYSHLPGAGEFFHNVNTPQDLDRAGEIERKLSGEDVI